ncbi:AMP-binding protein [Amycolatopsis sp. NPDC101161]|uniref:AMP-binding protein n=1 Tax=Amycolatopsis sp. NPDC101161 TaxID=3363940 RepID=UPI0037F4C9D4
MAEGDAGQGGFRVAPLLVSVEASRLSEQALAEYFGPATVLVRYRTEDELAAVIGRLPASLTASVHLGARETSPQWLAAGDGRTAGVQQLPDGRRGRLDPAPRGTVARHQQPVHLGRGDRDPPVPAAGDLAGRTGEDATGRAARAPRAPGAPPGERRAATTRKFDAAEVVATIERERPTNIWLASAMMNAILQLPDFASRDTSSIRFIIGGGEKMPVPLVARIVAAFPNAWLGVAAR